MAAACSLALFGTLAVSGSHDADAQAGGKPNIVMILTDDQALEEMRALPQTSALIGGGGVIFNRAYISYPLCCPARATLLSGQMMHNNGVRGNNAPTGGWTRFEAGAEPNALPTWLKSAGYYNVQVGKYMNGYAGAEAPVPAGWDEWYAKLSEYDANVHGGRIYFNYQMREDPPSTGGVPCPSGGPAVPGEAHNCFYGQNASDYQTDVLRVKAVEAIERLSNGPGAQTPFFLSVSLNAPHSPYVPAPRHQGLFAGLPVSKPKGSNEKNLRDKPRFLRRLPKLGKGKLRQIVKRRRARLEMLLSVDETVAQIMHTLHSEGQLGNTYVIFMSDNGYFSGEHRIRQGKFLPHEPSSHVPLMIRGPGIPPGSQSWALASNVDIASTIAHAAGASPTITQDGVSLLPFASSPGATSNRPLLLEGDVGPSIDDDGAETVAGQRDSKRLKRFYKKLRKKKRRIKQHCRALKRISPKRALRCARRGVANLEQEPTDTSYKLRAPAYSALRTQRYALHLYSSGEVELYDMAKDRHQLKSVHHNRRYAKIRKWMLARLNERANCAGALCTEAIGDPPKPAKKKKKKRKTQRR